MEPTLNLRIHGSHSLTIADIWPDGDAPDNPGWEEIVARLRTIDLSKFVSPTYSLNGHAF